MVFIALGANQRAEYQGEPHNPKQTFLHIMKILNAKNVTVLATSGLWQSPAWPDSNAQPAYHNAVIKVVTPLSPIDLLVLLKQLEREFGRKPTVRNSPRPLDLDILDYEGEIITSDRLILPHPRMCDRGFVLFPLQEIAPNWYDPIKNRAIIEWIARLKLKDIEALQWLEPLFKP